MTQLLYIAFQQTATKAAIKTKELLSIKRNDTEKVGFHTQIGRITQPYNREITGLSRMHKRYQ